MDEAHLASLIEAAVRRVLAERDESLVSTDEAAPQIDVAPQTLRRWLREQRAAGLATPITRAAVEYDQGRGRRPLVRWRLSVLKQWRSE